MISYGSKIYLIEIVGTLKILEDVNIWVCKNSKL